MRLIYSALLSLFLLALLSAPVYAATYYVDATGGDDANTGTSEATAWQSIGQVTGSTYLPGDHILFKRGENWTNQIFTFSDVAGTEAAPIVIGTYGDPSLPPPLLDATNPISGSWTPLGNNIYSTPLTSQTYVLFYKDVAEKDITTLQFSTVPSELKPGAILIQNDGGYTNFWVTSTTATTVSGYTYFTIDPTAKVTVRQIEGGEETWWERTGTPVSDLGLPTIVYNTNGLTQPGHWYWTGGTLYLNSDVDPNTLTINYGKIDYGIYLRNCNYVTFEGFDIKGGNRVGAYIADGANNIVRQNSIYGVGTKTNRSGILLYNTNNNLVSDNTVDSVLSAGITLYAWDPANPPTNTVQNNIISGNTIINPGGTGISLGTDTSGHAELNSGNIIENNTVIGANRLSYDSGGIYSLIAGSNTIRSNTIKNGGSDQLRSSGILADKKTSPLIIDSNIFENNSNGGVVVSDPSHVITNNTFINNGSPVRNSAQIVFFSVDWVVFPKDITVTGNTMVADNTRNFFWVESGSDIGHTIECNDYVGGRSTPFFWGTNGWKSFTDWKAVSGHEAHCSFPWDMFLPAIISTSP